jgi:hypothetical protein
MDGKWYEIDSSIPPVDLWTTPRVGDFLISVSDMNVVEIDARDHLMTEQHFALRISPGTGF